MTGVGVQTFYEKETKGKKGENPAEPVEEKKEKVLFKWDTEDDFMRKGEKPRNIKEEEIQAFNEEYKLELEAKAHADKKKQYMLDKNLPKKAPVMLSRAGFKRGEKQTQETVPEEKLPDVAQDEEKNPTKESHKEKKSRKGSLNEKAPRKDSKNITDSKPKDEKEKNSKAQQIKESKQN